MGLVRFWSERWRQMQRQQQFLQLCAANDLTLDVDQNIDDLETLKEIFIDRMYADYFPFYQKATVLDIGAHKGYFSLFCVKHLDQAARIVAIEPYAPHVETLRQNLVLNGAPHISVLPLGVSDHSGQAHLYLGRSDNHSLFAQHSALLKRPKATDTVTVSVRSLKDLLAELQLDRVDFLKMDCEGAEYGALLAADRETLEKIQTISLEFHDLKDLRYTGLTLVNHLKTQGFHIAKFAHGATTINNNYGYLVATRA